MELTSSDYMSIIGALISVIAMLATSFVMVQINALRKENDKLWEQVGELRGSLQQTRENYVSKKDFDGAILRLMAKLDSIEETVINLIVKSPSRLKDLSRD